MESDAIAYSALNKPQYDLGCDFVRSLKISEGDKVLDMGCGTGDVTNFIVSLVGPHGEVVGVDPDEARIKIAQEKFKDVKNLHFVVGDSSSKLPPEEYYDLHFSSNAFHWCMGYQKKVYLKKAYQCLKPGGRLALVAPMKSETSIHARDCSVELLTEVEYKELCESCLFNVVLTKIIHADFAVAHFTDFEIFKAWFKATTHCNFNDLDPDGVKLILERTKTEADGSITIVDFFFCLVGEKRGMT